VSLRHHDPQAGSAIENAEAGSAIECFCRELIYKIFTYLLVLNMSKNWFFVYNQGFFK
jgi:hypothetical protein